MDPGRSRSRAPNRSSTRTPYTEPYTELSEITTKSSGPYNRNFLQNLIDHNIFPPMYRPPSGTQPAKPNNWEEVQQRLSRRRSSLSPSRFSETRYKGFVQAHYSAKKEQQIRESIVPIIEGNIEDAKCRSEGILLSNLDDLTDFKFVPGNPDIYYGARPKQLDPRIRDELDRQIIPSTQHNLPLAPNFFLTVKGPDGSSEVATKQALYDGALGARGMHSLQSYQQDESIDSHAATITAIYYGGQLGQMSMYIIHHAQSGDNRDRPEYYMHQLNSWSMIGNIETFRQGATAYRNARDWAKEQRDEAIRHANGQLR